MGDDAQVSSDDGPAWTPGPGTTMSPQDVQRMMSDLHQARGLQLVVSRWGALVSSGAAVRLAGDTVRYRWQRCRRGWSEQDVWALGYTTCLRLADQLEFLAEHGWGYPGTPSYPTPEDWQRQLLATAADLRKVDAELPTPEATRDALRWVADHLDQLWD